MRKSTTPAGIKKIFFHTKRNAQIRIEELIFFSSVPLNNNGDCLVFPHDCAFSKHFFFRLTRITGILNLQKDLVVYVYIILFKRFYVLHCWWFLKTWNAWKWWLMYRKKMSERWVWYIIHGVRAWSEYVRFCSRLLNGVSFLVDSWNKDGG